jgi:1-acyl-sn-glycerol-3-phosphate acyltransferase
MPNTRPQIPPFYECIRVIADWFFSTFYDYSTSGMNSVPLTGSAIFAANHISFYDPPAIGAVPSITSLVTHSIKACLAKHCSS